MGETKARLSRIVKGLKLAIKPRKKCGPRKVFCIGLQKTGTTTFQQCMETLGYDHKGNSPEVFHDWRRGNKASLRNVIEKYDSFDDVPYFVLYREIFDLCGKDALYVLTLRSSAQTWVDSMKSHAMQSRPWTSNFENIYGHAYPHGYEEEFADYYEAHRNGVLAFFREQGALENLCELCWETGDGWQQLCGFLGHPVPDVPFPHARRRRRADPQREIDNMVRANYQMLERLASRKR